MSRRNPPATPRKPRGLRLRGREGPQVEGHVAERWMALVRDRFSPDVVEEAIRVARSGQVSTLAVDAGELTGRVRVGGSARSVRLSIDAWSAEVWDAVVEAMAAEAIHLVKLLEGDVPPEIDGLLARQGLALLPASARELLVEGVGWPDDPVAAGPTVATPAARAAEGEAGEDDAEQPEDDARDEPGEGAEGDADRAPAAAAGHARDPRATWSSGMDPGRARAIASACIALLFAEQLSRDPRAAIALRGLDPARLLDRLRQARTIRSRGVASAHVDPMIPETQGEPAPLDSVIEDYWRPGPRFHEFEIAPPPKHVEHALLKRLGPSPLPGRFPLVGLLASIYDTVREDAQRRQRAVEDLAGAEEPAPSSPDEADGVLDG